MVAHINKATLFNRKTIKSRNNWFLKGGFLNKH